MVVIVQRKTGMQRQAFFVIVVTFKMGDYKYTLKWRSHWERAIENKFKVLIKQYLRILIRVGALR